MYASCCCLKSIKHLFVEEEECMKKSSLPVDIPEFPKSLFLKTARVTSCNIPLSFFLFLDAYREIIKSWDNNLTDKAVKGSHNSIFI